MTNLDELEELERKATKGPWHDASGKGSAVVSAPGENCAVYLNVRAVELDETVARWQADAALIVALRNEAVPMIQELRELRNEVEEHKAIKRHVARRVIEAIGASGPENLNDSVGRLLAERDALRAQLATAREDALEEAALEASEHMAHACRAAGMTSGECVAESIRALKTTKGTT